MIAVLECSAMGAVTLFGLVWNWRNVLTGRYDKKEES